MAKHLTTSTNVTSRSVFDGGSLAAYEHQRHAAVVADIQQAWSRDTQAMLASIPSLVARAAPRLQQGLASELSRCLVLIIKRELDGISRDIDGVGDSLTGIIAAEPQIEAAHALLRLGFRPLLELARDIARIFDRVAPKSVASSPDAHHVPLISFARDGKSALTQLVRVIFARQVHVPQLTETISQNLARATGHDPGDDSRALNAPHTLDGGADAVALLTFGDTPLLKILLSPIPIVIPLETRFRHTHLIAGTGWGKTQALQHDIALFLSSPTPPSLVIIDSQSEMLRKIERLALFAPGQGRLQDRLVIIDPTDIAHPPSLNLFAVNHARLARVGAAAREQFMNGLVELYETISGAILGADMTPKQLLLFRFLTRLMLAIPGATIQTLIEALHDLAPFAPAIATLNGTAHDFLSRQAGSKDYLSTRDQILRRLYSILEQPTFERMFSAPGLKLDLFECMQSGKIVLVNTAKDFLKTERSMILGRVFAALTLQATIERAAVAPDRRRPAFLIMDEAHEYLDGSTQQILEQARKYKVGLIAAHQGLEQLSPSLKASLATNTAIKMAGGVNDADAHTLAREMKTTPDAIRSLERGERSTTFLTYIDGTTPQALPLKIPFGTLERMPVMTETQHRQLIADNRRRISFVSPSSPIKPEPHPRRDDPPPAGKGRSTPTVPKPPDDWWS